MLFDGLDVYLQHTLNTIGTASANSGGFRGIGSRMYIEDLL